MRKVIAIRRDRRPEAERYLSKNNLNIARLAAPPAPLDDGTFLVPFREPVQQAASMCRQHERFLDIHEKDDFVREYMEAIGHHEFGKGLRPVNFDGWLAQAEVPSQLAFWMEYWVAAYRHILHHSDESTVLVSYARLTEKPEASLARLAEVLDVSGGDLASQAEQLHPPRTHSVDRDTLSGTLLQKATELYEQLDRKAAV
jgi:NADH:ubiquinone oxidoreductase subunit